MEMPPESPARSTVQSIEAAALRTSELTQQLLAYSGKGKFLIQPINLSRLVEDMAPLLKISISKKATFRTRLTDNLPAVEADAVQMQQILLNLIINASEALGEKTGDIAISTGILDADRDYLSESFLDENLPEGRYVYLEVTDTGCGMDKETQRWIFDPFFTTKFTGRGLGLAAVLGIVRSHKGAIKLCSEPDQGTAFKVLFPSAERPIAIIQHSTESATWCGTATVLIIDDEEGVRVFVRKVLEMRGFTVLMGRDGRSGIDVFRAHAEDIRAVLLDLTMPDLSGEEVFRTIRTIRPM